MEIRIKLCVYMMFAIERLLLPMHFPSVRGLPIQLSHRVFLQIPHFYLPLLGRITSHDVNWMPSQDKST